MKRALLGEIEFSVVENENPSDSAEITDKPVEKGQDVADHVKIKPTIFNISGVVVGDDAYQKLQKLTNYHITGQILTYVGRNVYGNIVIEQFDRTHDSNVANGFTFNMKLKQVKIATAKEIIIANPKVRTQTKAVSSKGIQQAIQKQAENIQNERYEKKLARIYEIDSNNRGASGTF